MLNLIYIPSYQKPDLQSTVLANITCRASQNVQQQICSVYIKILFQYHLYFLYTLRPNLNKRKYESLKV